LFYLSFFFFSAQPSQIGCLPYFHTWCGLSAAAAAVAVAAVVVAAAAAVYELDNAIKLIVVCSYRKWEGPSRNQEGGFRVAKVETVMCLYTEWLKNLHHKAT